MGYDIIGDVHGQADALVRLLRHLGYLQKRGVWKHPDRHAIFVGDLIDRGPQQRETVNLVRRMVDTGSASVVMGNHEFDAIAWFLPDPATPGDYLRSHFSPRSGERHRKQHQAFLDEFERSPALHQEVIDWFLTLPLWVEIGGARIIHACWHPAHIHLLRSKLKSNRLNADLITTAFGETDRCSKLLNAAQILLRGIEAPLPLPYQFTDDSGHLRKSIQLKWWDTKATSYRAAAIVPEQIRGCLPDIPLPADIWTGYSDTTPVFFGHYWAHGTPKPVSRYAACVDYSAGWGYKLCAYRFDGEPKLRSDKFCAVEVTKT